VKLQDPVAPFRGIVAEHRRAHATSNAERFRLGGQAPAPRPSAGPVAVIGASEWALGSGRVEQTLAYIGALGGLLADLGYDVYAVSSLPDLDARPAFVGWVGGEETAAERSQLAVLGAPGLSIGPQVDGVETWSRIEPEGQPISIEFIRKALDEIRRLTAGGATPVDGQGGDPSTLPSTPPGGTGAHGVVRPGYGGPRNPSSKARSGTGWDRTNRRPSGS
jgi:hypothetical protein